MGFTAFTDGRDCVTFVKPVYDVAAFAILIEKLEVPSVVFVFIKLTGLTTCVVGGTEGVGAPLAEVVIVYVIAVAPLAPVHPIVYPRITFVASVDTTDIVG
jgi:hypothetical protein